MYNIEARVAYGTGSEFRIMIVESLLGQASYKSY
jgi:hypothetical protein